MFCAEGLYTVNSSSLQLWKVIAVSFFDWIWTLTKAAYYHFKESIFGTGCHTQQPGFLVSFRSCQLRGSMRPHWHLPPVDTRCKLRYAPNSTLAECSNFASLYLLVRGSLPSERNNFLFEGRTIWYREYPYKSYKAIQSQQIRTTNRNRLVTNSEWLLLQLRSFDQCYIYQTGWGSPALGLYWFVIVFHSILSIVHIFWLLNYETFDHVDLYDA